MGSSSFFFFNDTATTEIYTLSLHDALPIFAQRGGDGVEPLALGVVESHADTQRERDEDADAQDVRSEEHTSELQSRLHLVCRLLLEKKNTQQTTSSPINRLPPLASLHLAHT